ncbi:MAG TPA: tRNA preQ1(34) S-adenosylmethionine ribosyltransferase-isomerase QueA [Candidatus Deferrimicrobium sp.]|nr:tRNA preQ1(34) S-adenosylmethionine ribosyltransferase-isomerase QueA [Candidatus Deferrimicrobium sp.]
MDISLFDYQLPRELIAQYPSRRRDASRLMVVDRATGRTEVLPFRRIADFVGCGDALVVNNTKVFKARLVGRRATGANVEIFLIRTVRDVSNSTGKTKPACRWEALVSPSRRVRQNERILFGDKSVLLARDCGNGRWEVVFDSEAQRREIIARCGHVPLPHYIRREDQPDDLRRYQTVFASKDKVGAVAAPTAGFHFTRSLLDEMSQKSVRVIETCLHVGPGTFKPVTAQDIDDHVVDPEYAELSLQAARDINSIRNRGDDVFAVGTTTVRTLESAKIVDGKIQPFGDMVNLYIRPGFEFKIVNHLLTNFHLPRSSLLILVSAFAGRELIMEAYREAIRRRLRFYSYGDAMLIL